MGVRAGRAVPAAGLAAGAAAMATAAGWAVGPVSLVGPAAAAGSAAAAAPAVAAVAAPSGRLLIEPATGTDTTPMLVTTSGPCPRPATNILGRVYGPGFPLGTNIIGNTATGVSNTGPFLQPLSATLGSIAADQSPPVELHGTYTFVVICRMPLFPNSYADFRGSIAFVSPHRYVLTAKQAPVPRLVSAGPGVPTAPPPPTGASAAPSARPAAAATQPPPGAPAGHSRTGLVAALAAAVLAAGMVAAAVVLPARRRRASGLPATARRAGPRPAKPGRSKQGGDSSDATRRHPPANSSAPDHRSRR